MKKTIALLGAPEGRMVLPDFLPQNQGPSRADLYLECGEKGDLVLHLLEITKR